MTNVLVSHSMSLSRHDRKEKYRGWTLEIDIAPQPFAYEFYEPSICFGKAYARFDNHEGLREICQPFWLTMQEMRDLKTDVQKAAALDFMLTKAKNLLKKSVDRFRSGKLQVPPQGYMGAPVLERIAKGLERPIHVDQTSESNVLQAPGYSGGRGKETETPYEAG